MKHVVSRVVIGSLMAVALGFAVMPVEASNLLNSSSLSSGGGGFQAGTGGGVGSAAYNSLDTSAAPATPAPATPATTDTAAADAAAKKQKECDDATKAAGEKESAATQKEMEKKCDVVEYETAAPKSAAQERLLSQESMDSGANSNDSAYTEIAVKQGNFNAGNADALSAANTRLTNSDRFGMSNERTLQSSITEGTRVNSVKVDDAYLNARYDPAKVVIGGQGSGVVECPTCPGKKYGANANDGSYQTTMNQARTRSIEKGEWFTTDENGLDKGYLVTKDMPAGVTSDQLQMVKQIQSMGEANGLNQTVIDTTIQDFYRESKFQTVAQNPGSSAYGLGQYVGGTWLDSTDVLNRNNTFDQIKQQLVDVDNRYTKYANSASLQSKYSFGEYDYIIHYAGSTSAPQTRINEALAHYSKTTGVGSKFVEYANNGVASDVGKATIGKSYDFGEGPGFGNGASVASKGKGYSFDGTAAVAGASGNTIKAAANNIVSAIGSGNVSGAVGSAMSSLGLSTGQPMLDSLMQQQLASLLSGSGSSGNTAATSAGTTTATASAGATASTGTTTTTTTTTTSDVQRGYDAVAQLAKTCGKDLPANADALMLMVKECQAAGASS